MVGEAIVESPQTLAGTNWLCQANPNERKGVFYRACPAREAAAATGSKRQDRAKAARRFGREKKKEPPNLGTPLLLDAGEERAVDSVEREKSRDRNSNPKHKLSVAVYEVEERVWTRGDRDNRGGAAPSKSDFRACYACCAVLNFQVGLAEGKLRR